MLVDLASSSKPNLPGLRNMRLEVNLILAAALVFAGNFLLTNILTLEGT